MSFDYSKSISWSQIASFEYDPEQWFSRYILGEKSPDTPQTLFGKEVGERLATDPTFLPEIERYDVFEQKLEARIDDFALVGYLDSFDSVDKHFLEYKTSSNKKKWTKKSAQDHGQLKMYAFLIWKNYGIPPESLKIKLYAIPVEQKGDFTMGIDEKSKIECFEVKLTVLDVLKFGKYIKDTRKKMIEYAEKKLSTTILA